MRALSLAVLVVVGCAGGDDAPPPPVDGSLDPVEAYDPLDLVDPIVGTGGTGAEIANVNPGASAPFGMTLVGPDTRQASGAPLFFHCAGYWHPDDQIYQFSLTHAHGMGVVDYGTIPFIATPAWRDALTSWDDRGAAAVFSHGDEVARPGFYEVTTADGVTTAITATPHGAIVRFRFPEGAAPALILPFDHPLPSNEITDVALSATAGDPVVTGYQRTRGSYSGRFGGVRHWLHATLDPAPTGGGAWTDPANPEAGTLEVAAERAGMWLTFPPGTTEVVMRAAISTVDAEGAARNHAAEVAGRTLDEVVAETEDAWRGLLGRVRVRGGTEDERVIFHTAMYHAALMPSLQSDVDGRYRAMDQEIRTADHPVYSDLSLWDTFRTLHPWMIQVWPEVQADVNRSLLRMTADGGSLPRWPLAHGYTSGMVGTPAIQVLVESALKGVEGFDVDAAWEASWAAATASQANAGRRAIDTYRTVGFVPAESGGGSVSHTLEYAWSDASLAELAELLGRGEDADTLRETARATRAQWSEELGFFAARCLDPSDARCNRGGFEWPERGERPDFIWQNAYVEGNAWHYLWYMPWDVDFMIDVQHGGDREAFLTRLSSYWYDGVFVEPDDLLPDDWYWHGNEPVMHYAWLGSLAGEPTITADASRWVLANRYWNAPRGLDGNDDAGTLSAWYLLGATGMFPVAGTRQVALGSPLFERMEFDRPDGSTWIVRAPGTSDARRYVAALTVGGAPVDDAVVDWGDLTSGEVVFTLSEDPTEWGRR